MATLKLSNWSTCRYIRSDLGPLAAKYVLLFAKCRYSRCRYTRRVLCGSKWRKVLGEKGSRQEINDVISDMSLYPILLHPKFTVDTLPSEMQFDLSIKTRLASTCYVQ